MFLRINSHTNRLKLVKQIIKKEIILYSQRMTYTVTHCKIDQINVIIYK